MPERTRVVATRALGPFSVVTLEASFEPGVPGQFHMLRVAGSPAFLPRPLSAVRVGEHGIEFLCQLSGKALAPLAEVGCEVVVSGPFGRGFDLSSAGQRPLLVGGGFGVALLAGVAAALPGSRLHAGFGDAEAARTSELVPAAEVVTAIAPDLVTPPYAEASAIFAAGPMAMMQAVARGASEAGVPSQVALEAPMACGYGACYGCAVRLGGRIVRLCVEGPVVDGMLL